MAKNDKVQANHPPKMRAALAQLSRQVLRSYQDILKIVDQDDNPIRDQDLKYFRKKVSAAATMLSWYDDAASLEAKKAKLQADLDEVESKLAKAKKVDAKA